MHNLLLDYVNTNNNLSPNQFGFREKHSTYMALLKLIDDISEEIDNKNFSVSVFIDLSKAFDTINHDIVIKKLNAYGIIDVALEWLKNYLTNILQYVSINCTDSSFFANYLWCSQSSILGSLLFILYINDIFNTSNLAKFILIVYDTNLFFKHQDLETFINTINTEIAKIVSCFKIKKTFFEH